MKLVKTFNNEGVCAFSCNEPKHKIGRENKLYFRAAAPKMSDANGGEGCHKEGNVLS